MTVKAAEEEPVTNPVESPPLAKAQIHSKVGASAIGGAISILLVWGVSHWTRVPVPEAQAISLLLGVAAGYVAKS